MFESTNSKDDWKYKVLVSYSKSGLLIASIHAAKTSSIIFFKEKRNNPSFARDVHHSKKLYSESLVAEAHRRAVVGVERIDYYQGQKIGTHQEYSDTLLQALLKANLPNKFAVRPMEITNNVSVSQTNKEELRKAHEIIAGDKSLRRMMDTLADKVNGKIGEIDRQE